MFIQSRDCENRRLVQAKEEPGRSMSTGARAARAATSRKVKQELVRRLFGQKYSKKGPEAHRRLDSSIYSFTDLKRAYLGRLQEIHPDKANAQEDFNDAETLKCQFQDLQDAWTNYEEMARTMRTTGSGNEEEANFTKFGVGCSFSDNEQERVLRDEIMDQACRGWFSSGLLSETTESATQNPGIDLQPISLVDDDLFEETSEEMLKASTSAEYPIDKPNLKPKHLIPGWR